MDVLKVKIICVCITMACCIAPYNNAFAVIISPPTTAPISLLDGEDLNVTSGILATKNDTNYTVNYQPNTADQLVTISPGATVSYQGSNSSASTFLSVRDDTTAVQQNIINNGTINRGSGRYAINFVNSNVAPGNDATIINNNGATIIGDIVFNGHSAGLIINGHPAVAGTSQVQGNILFNSAVGGNVVGVGYSVPGSSFAPGSSFISGGTIDNLSDLLIFEYSTMTLNYAATLIKNVLVQNNSTLNLNASLSGISAADGELILDIASILNVAADITKTGVFNSFSGSTVRVKKNVNINTSTYDANAGTHIVQLTDLSNYGKATFSFASPEFSVFNTEYTGGYFAAGTYTLVDAAAIGVAPTSYGPPPMSTRFLSFGTPYDTADSILIDITRTGFQNFASNGFTQKIANAVEYVGTHNPPENFVSVLNALERSASTAQLNTGLRELAPIISAPLYTFMLQDPIYEQVHMRIADKKKNPYSSGEQYSDYTPWLRGLYDKAKQDALEDCSGYYATTGGGFIGVDKQVNPNFAIGLAFAYTNSRVDDQINGNSYTNIYGYNFMLYGSHDCQPWYATWVLGLGDINYNANRNIDFNGLLLNASGKYHNYQIGGNVLIGSNFRPINYLQISPEASILYSMGTSYDYNEIDGAGANLQISSDTAYFAQTTAGVKIESPLVVHSMILMPEVHVKGLYNIVNGNQNMYSSFLAGGPQFVSSAGLSRFGLKYGASITLATSDTLELKLNYDHTTLGGYNDNVYYLNVRYTL